MILAGPVGEALAALGNERWQRATNRTLRDLSGVGESWPDDLDPDFRDVEVAISRTRAEYDGFPEIREIERLYLDLIAGARRSEEHTSELQSLMRISYAVFCLKKKTKTQYTQKHVRHQLLETTENSHTQRENKHR